MESRVLQSEQPDLPENVLGPARSRSGFEPARGGTKAARHGRSVRTARKPLYQNQAAGREWYRDHAAASPNYRTLAGRGIRWAEKRDSLLVSRRHAGFVESIGRLREQ